MKLGPLSAEEGLRSRRRGWEACTAARKDRRREEIEEDRREEEDGALLVLRTAVLPKRIRGGGCHLHLFTEAVKVTARLIESSRRERSLREPPNSRSYPKKSPFCKPFGDDR